MAQQAIEVLNGSNLNGAQVRCRLDRNARDRVRSTNQHRAHISNLSSNTTTEDLTAHFESIGLVTGCDIRTARNSDGGNESPSSGYVEFMDSRRWVCCKLSDLINYYLLFYCLYYYQHYCFNE